MDKQNLKEMKKDNFLPTGYDGWDGLSGGLKKGEVTLIASRPGVGKTSLALNIVNHITGQQPGTILMFSPHMPSREVASRLFSIGTGLTAEAMLDGSVSATELADKYTKYFHTQKAHIQMNLSSWMTLENITQHCHDTPDLQLVVIHHLERVCKPWQLWGKGLSWQENREPRETVLQALQALARELHVPILCTAHVHRSVERRKNKHPRLADLKKMETPAELVDQVVFLYRDRYYDPDGKEGTECMIAKSSQGTTGLVELSWDPTTGRFL